MLTVERDSKFTPDSIDTYAKLTPDAKKTLNDIQEHFKTMGRNNESDERIIKNALSCFAFVVGVYDTV